jgi:hypothetical protein
MFCRLDKKIQYCLIISLLTILFLLIVYPNLPTAPASFYQDKNYFYVTPSNLPTTSLVCGNNKKSERCSSINDERKNYDIPILKDLDNFLDLLKKKLYAEETPSFLLVDIGSHVGFFSFSVADSLSSPVTSPLPKSESKILAIDANEENIQSMIRTKEISGKKRTFENVEPIRQLIGSSTAKRQHCALASSDDDVNDLSLICFASETTELGQRISLGKHKSAVIVRSMVISSSTNSNNDHQFAAVDSILEPKLQHTSTYEIKVVRIDVGDEANTLSVLESGQQTLLSSRITSSSNENNWKLSNAQIVIVRLTSYDSLPDARKSEKILRLMHQFGYVPFLPENRTTLFPKDFAGSLFETVSFAASSSAVTIYFIRGDVSNILLCNEVDVPFLLLSIGGMIVLGAAYIYWMNSRAQAMFNMASAMSSLNTHSNNNSLHAFQKGGMMSSGFVGSGSTTTMTHGFPMVTIGKN